MALDLSKIGERDRLKPRPGDEPHWQRLRAGCFLGFRPTKMGGRGTWLARAYDLDLRRYQRKPLGDFGALAGNDVFTAAKREAEAFADVVESGGVAVQKLTTVADACREYAKSKPDAVGRLERLVYPDPLARIELTKLRRHHVDAWRKRLAEQPALISRAKLGYQRVRVRAPSTINRDMVPLRAALTRVLAPGTPGTAAAWQDALRPIRNADRQRTAYLTRGQRKALLNAIDPQAAPFVRALCLLPLRPGAMAKLSVSDFDQNTRELTIGTDKTGKSRRIILPQVAADFLIGETNGKLSCMPLFMRSNGRRWTKDTWNEPIKLAAKITKCELPISAYVFRHAIITDLVNSGLAILTIAQISGTSIEMIERHYGHLNKNAAETALASLVL